MTTRKAGLKGSKATSGDVARPKDDPPTAPLNVINIRPKRPPVAWLHDPAATDEMLDLTARLRGLDNLARRIFIDRNATGMPLAYRSEIKRTTRHHHREAIAMLRAARTALLVGDAGKWELLSVKACAKLEHVQVLFRQPVVKKAAPIEKQRGHNKGDVSAKTALYLALKRRNPTYGQKAIAAYISKTVGKGSDPAVDACFWVNSEHRLIDRSMGREVSAKQVSEQAKAALRRAKAASPAK